MGCDRYQEELIDVAAGADATPVVQAHLRECAVCRARVEEGRRLLGELERGLADALRVTPSPGFEARLRNALAGDADRKSWFVRWVPALAAALVIASLVAWTLIGKEREPAPVLPRAVSIPTPSPVAPASATPGPVEPPARPSREPPPTATAHVRHPNGRRLARVKEPEIIVPPGQEEAIAQLVAMLRSRRVEPGSLLADGLSANTPLVDIKPLAIPPLEMAAPLEVSEGRSDS